MPNPPRIQDISPALVDKILICESIGTYLLRARTSNDDILSLIKFPNRSIRRSYVVLSIRVDQKFYLSSILHYRLPLIDDDILKTIDFYKSRKNLPKLKHELIISDINRHWNFNRKESIIKKLSRKNFDGKNNNGLAEGYWRKSKQNEEIKIFIKCFQRNNNSFENEFHILKQLSYFPIIKFFGQYSDHQYNYLVFEHINRTLKSICPLQQQQQPIKHLVNIAYQLSDAMMYLEKKNIVHRDLTADNILIDNQGLIKIIDFGHALQKIPGKNNLCQLLTNKGEHRFQVRFLAPECIRQIKDTNQQLYVNFTSKSDVWSFGLVLIQLMLDQPSQPYPNIKNNLDVASYVVIQRKIHPQPINCNLDIYYILEQCWAYEPRDRLTFEEIRDKMKMLMTILF